MSLLDYVTRQQDHALSTAAVKWAVTYLLQAVDYLHTSIMVHTGTRLESYRSSPSLMIFLQTSNLTTSKTHFQMKRMQSLQASSTLNV